MYFGLTDEAAAFRDGLRSVLPTACTPSVIRAAWDGDPCEGLWKTLGEYGVIGLLAPEADGGLGLDELALVAALEECGYAGVPGPLVETIISAPLTGLPLDGSARTAVMRELGPVAYLGLSTHVLDVTSPAGLADLSRCEVAVEETVDRSRQIGDLRGVSAPAEVTDEQRELLLARGTLGTAAFLLGLARRQIDMTVSYAKERKQFGVAIGTFQAIKHPLADAVVGTELAWPVVLHAAHALATGAPDAHIRVAHAKAAASDAAYQVSRVCLQAHGAIGYTVEYDLHLFMKRTWALAQDWGSASDHRMTIAKELL